MPPPIVMSSRSRDHESGELAERAFDGLSTNVDTGREPLWRKAREVLSVESFALVAVGVNQG